MNRDLHLISWAMLFLVAFLCVPAAAQRAKPVRVKLNTGDVAPDISLARLAADGTAGEKVTISSFAGERPVVLVFSSYT